MGFADLLSTVLLYHMAKHLDTVTSFTWLYGLLIVSSLSLVIAQALSPGVSVLFTLSILGMRIASFASYLNYVTVA